MQSFVSTQNQAVQRLYSSHHQWLQSWLGKKLGCRNQAADLAQDTFVRVLLKPELTDTREPRAFLTTIARGLLIDHWRREDLERAWLTFLTHLPESEIPSIESSRLILEFLEQIVVMLDSLKPKVRMAFLLSRIDGLSNAQIAAKLEISTRTVERHVAEALYHCYTLRYAY